MTFSTEIRLLMDLRSRLDTAKRWVDAGDYHRAFSLLGEGLSASWDQAFDEGLLATCRNLGRAHPMFGICQEDPFTGRAFNKPRGYAGDAVMLDYVYDGKPPPETSIAGAAVFECTTRCPMGLSVSFRKHLLTAYINDVVSRDRQARILLLLGIAANLSPPTSWPPGSTESSLPSTKTRNPARKWPGVTARSGPSREASANSCAIPWTWAPSTSSIRPGSTTTCRGRRPRV